METSRKLKILFVIRSVNHFFHYKSIIRFFCERGHDLVVLFDRGWSENISLEEIGNFKNKYSNFVWTWSLRRRGLLRPFIFFVREVINYRRYLLTKGQSVYYFKRWRSYLPFWMRILVRVPGINFLIKTNFFGEVLKFLNNLAPADKKIIEDIKSRNPDVVVAAPVNMRFSEEVEYIKAAKELNIPTATPIFSWDTLTTKGTFNILPDLITVWNKIQFNEAVNIHGVLSSIIKITGASNFDSWFGDMKPSMSREEFCRAHGLKPEFPIVTYLGSSRNIAHNETWLIKELRKELNSSQDDKLRNLQIIARPHSANFKVYQNIEEDKLIVLPKHGELPNTQSSLQLFYDTLYYSVATAGINTSAMIDAIVVGKPVIALLRSEYEKTQQEAQHFQYLNNSKAVGVAGTSEEFLQLMKRLLDGFDDLKSNRNAFIIDFVRPRGINFAAGELAVIEIERLVGKS